MSVTCSKAHVVLLSSPGIGHLSPIVELAKRLALDHNLTATIITFFDRSSDIQQSMFSSLPIGVSTVCLPPISLDDLPTNTHIISRLSIMISRSIPFLRQILLDLQIKNKRIAAYIIDLFGGDTICLARELGAPSYIFFTTNFFYLSFLLNLPTLCHEQHDNNPDSLLALPGCTPLYHNDFPQSAIDKKSDVFAWMIHHSKHHDKVDGIMVNSFEAMEGGVVRFLKERRNGKSPILPIGPLTCVGGSEKGLAKLNSCLQWLDQQPV
ncbi:UDP-glycosyltransferase 72B1-like, partial [Phalaenopsis equestris]|uniref:UDP-glycosyltransferase 72B1-like n=2 Tax=Phalaenopsis equestris TaxID=78828 RepID=UPI0009E36015